MLGLDEFREAVIQLCECLSKKLTERDKHHRTVEVLHYVDNDTHAVNIFVSYPSCEDIDIDAMAKAGIVSPHLSSHFRIHVPPKSVAYMSQDMYATFIKTAQYVKLPKQELIDFWCSGVCNLVADQIIKYLGESNEHSTGQAPSG